MLASINAGEWDEGLSILREPMAAQVVDEARRIVAEYFNDVFATGVVRIVEFANTKQGVRLAAEAATLFVRDLSDLFAV